MADNAFQKFDKQVKALQSKAVDSAASVGVPEPRESKAEKKQVEVKDEGIRTATTSVDSSSADEVTRENNDEVMDSKVSVDAPVQSMESDEKSIKEEEYKIVRVTMRTCPRCESKRPLSADCVNSTCKKCCRMTGEVCQVHPKKKALQEVPRLRKTVLKKEFREANFVYYEETVSLFCIRDFFENTKICRGVLNDQTRSKRAGGSYDGMQKLRRKRVRDEPNPIEEVLKAGRKERI